jgi:glutaredoxin-dependent peroxiredoxin
MAVKISDAAPDFTLFDTDKKPVSLSSFRGEKNVLLLFFPMAFTSTCTAELCSVRDDISRYSNINAQVLGISVDSVFTLEKYKQDQGYNFPLLSDFNKEVSKAYDTLYETFTPMLMKGVSKRSAFLIDKMGIIQFAEVLENAGEIPDFNAINSLLEKVS